ncbi:hypothetical protein AB3S75_002766 [Citrus x aurantiifolia]
MQFKRFCSYVVVINVYRLCILPFFLAHQEIPGLDIIVDPCAAIIVLFVTGLLCVGIKEPCQKGWSSQLSFYKTSSRGEFNRILLSSTNYLA